MKRETVAGERKIEIGRETRFERDRKIGEGERERQGYEREKEKKRQKWERESEDTGV